MQWSLIKDNIVIDIILSNDEEFVKNYAKENHYEYVLYDEHTKPNIGWVRNKNGFFNNPKGEPEFHEITKGLPQPESSNMEEI